MPADVTEQRSSEELLEEFRNRYSALAEETRKLQAKIRENENTGLKLMGAIETLEYLLNPKDTEEEGTQTEE
jgi:hypothetical protein